MGKQTKVFRLNNGNFKIYERVWKNPRASFKGKNNASKGQILVLLDLIVREFVGDGLTLRQMADHSTVSYQYLKFRLPRWSDSWHYLNKRAVSIPNQRPVYKYSLGERGKHFINDVMSYDKYMDFQDTLALLPANKEWFRHIHVTRKEDITEDKKADANNTRDIKGALLVVGDSKPEPAAKTETYIQSSQGKPLIEVSKKEQPIKEPETFLKSS